VRGAALVARRAEIYQIKSASFRTSGKEIVTWFDSGSLDILLRPLHEKHGDVHVVLFQHHQVAIAADADFG
jgi:hypothetical protein